MIRTKKDFILQKMMDAYMIIAVGDSGEQFHDILKTNETGAFYWKQLEKGTTVDDMVKESLQHFDDVSEVVARKDIEEFLQNISDAIENV